MNIYRDRGLSPEQQRQAVKAQKERYNSDIIFVEDNAYQAFFVKDLIETTSLPIKGFRTGANKRDEIIGLNALALQFENKNFIIPYGVLTHVFGRIGCFLNGCCYGKVCDLSWAVKFPGLAYAVHPTQLYEALYDLVLFFFLNYRRKQPHFDGQISLLYFALYGMGRYLIEFLREPGWTGWGLTANQWLSAAIILFAFIVFMNHQKKTK